MKKKSLTNILPLILVFALLALGLSTVVGCSQSTSSPSESKPAVQSTPVKLSESVPALKPASSQFEVVRAAADAYLSTDKAKNSNIKSEDLYYNLNDGDTSNDPFLVEVRAVADYEKGHIPGAINIPWREIAKKENLVKLPKDKPIVVYCYSGQTGSQVTAILNTLGYNVQNLRYGMTSWTKNDTIAPNRFDPDKAAKDYKIETTVNVPTRTYDFPVLSNTTSEDTFEIIRSAADAYLSSDRGKDTNIKSEDLYYILNDGDAANNPLVLSVRAKADYELGHVPGAINIPWQEVAKTENLAKLPTDKTIVAYCYTGHTGSQANAVLNLLGYTSRNMSYGIGSWTKDMTVVKTRFDNSKDAKDYKYVTGTNPR